MPRNQNIWKSSFLEGRLVAFQQEDAWPSLEECRSVCSLARRPHIPLALQAKVVPRCISPPILLPGLAFAHPREISPTHEPSPIRSNGSEAPAFVPTQCSQIHLA